MTDIPQNPFSDKDRVLYVMNLPYDASKEEVNDLFIGYEVEHIEFVKMKGGNPSGNALVQFSTNDQAESANQIDREKQIRDHLIHIKPAKQKYIRDYHDGEFCAKVRRSDDESKSAREFKRNREYFEYFSSDILHDMKEGFQEVLTTITAMDKSTGESIKKLDARITEMDKSIGESITKLDDRITEMDKSIGESITKLDDRITAMGRTLDKNFAKIANQPQFDKFINE